MNLYQCEEAARDLDFEGAKFIALFPGGVFECQWLDAYIGIFKINNVKELEGKFFTTREVDKQYPDLYCSEPYLGESL